MRCNKEAIMELGNIIFGQMLTDEAIEHIMTLEEIMELGNIIFGHSRGEYQIERGTGFEKALIRLFAAYAPNRDNSWREYGVEFVNDTFEVHPYYWGDCTCGWDFLDSGHLKLERLEHRPDCYQSDYHRTYESAGHNHNKQVELLRDVYKCFGWDTSSPDWWHGCAIRCSCDYHQRYESILDEYTQSFGCKGHKETCLLVRPNFIHKPSGYKIMWYKYPLRDSYANQKLSLKQFNKIINECISTI